MRDADLMNIVSEDVRLVLLEALKALKRGRLRTFEIASEVAYIKGTPLPTSEDFGIIQIGELVLRLGGSG
jgi:hypothetical protein